VLNVVKEDLEPMADEKTTADHATIGRQELSKRIAKQAKLSQKQAAEVLEATLDAIREALQSGDEVRLVGFGSFKVRISAARDGVNPRDRTERIHVPEKPRVRFYPGKELSEAVVKK
jgi:nucleoid DNA-binding protein